MFRVAIGLIAIIGIALPAGAQYFEMKDLKGAYDLAAPVIQNRSYLTNAVPGQIIFDNSMGAFFGLPVGADPADAESWVQLSQVTGTDPVISTSELRIEQVRITNSGSCSGSASWVTSYNRASAGLCEITYASNTWSAPPTCTCTPKLIGGNPTSCSFSALPSSTLISFVTAQNNSLTPADTDFNVICIGPR